MFTRMSTLIATLAYLAVSIPCALGHVPYLEGADFSVEDPFVVPWKIEQSIAVAHSKPVHSDRQVAAELPGKEEGDSNDEVRTIDPGG